MPFSEKRLRTIKCDGPGCDKIVEFDLNDVKFVQTIEWLKGVRIVQTGDGRNISYCSDLCEVKGITSGAHNLPKPIEPSKVIESASEADVKAAAAQAEAARAGTEALKNGEQARVTLG